MKITEIKDYRKILIKEYSGKDLEIETSLSYISIGALGFCLTINEKFLKLPEANCRLLLILSLVFLFLAFVLILVRKSRTIHYDLGIIRFLDDMEEDSDNDDNELLTLWNKSHLMLKKIRTCIYYSLGTGIGLQVLFLFLN